MMKKGFAVFLLATFLYGTIFYPLQLWYRLYQHQEWSGKAGISSGTVTAASVSGAAKEVVFKTPLALPYSTDWEEPREASGLFEREGQFYTVVSTDYRQDTLYVTCFLNNNAREIFGVLSGLVKADSDEESDPKSNPISTLNSFSKKITKRPTLLVFVLLRFPI